jgi:hypothetical protein
VGSDDPTSSADSALLWARKLPLRRGRREVELSGRIWPGGSYEAVAIYRKPDRGDSERRGCRFAGPRGLAQARDQFGYFLLSMDGSPCGKKD